MMRFLMPVLAAALMALSTGGAYADLGDQLAKFIPDDGARGDAFGAAVSLSGDTAIVGARHADDACPDPENLSCNSGSAYIFQVDANGNWVQVVELNASDAEAGNEFGNSVSISGDTAIVGAHRSSQVGILSGSAYIFRRGLGGPDNWGEVIELTSPDTAASDAFGRSVSISGDIALVGAPIHDTAGHASGSAYIFQRDAGGPENWGQVAELAVTDPAAADLFGWSVSLSGDTAIVGAWGNDDNRIESGSAYIFQRDAGGPGNWGQVVKLIASDANVLDWFGFSVSLSDDTAMIGAPSNNDDGRDSGSAYIFQRDFGGADNWGEVAKLTASDAATFDYFGGAVSLSGGIAVAGATGADGGVPASGTAYVFHRDAGGADTWGEVMKLTAADSALRDNFGSGISLDGETAFVGAAFDDDACPANGSCDSGSAYLFDVGDGSSPGDLNCDGQINAFDIEPFLLALFDPDEYAIRFPDCDINNGDINGDGSIDAFDIEPFLALLFP